MIRSKFLGVEALRVYQSGKECAYDHVKHDKILPFKKGTDSQLKIKVNPQKRPALH